KIAGGFRCGRVAVNRFPFPLCSARVSRVGESVPLSRTSEKIVSARRRNQHARHVRYTESLRADFCGGTRFFTSLQQITPRRNGVVFWRNRRPPQINLCA